MKRQRPSARMAVKARDPLEAYLVQLTTGSLGPLERRPGGHRPAGLRPSVSGNRLPSPRGAPGGGFQLQSKRRGCGRIGRQPVRRIHAGIRQLRRGPASGCRCQRGLVGEARVRRRCGHRHCPRERLVVEDCRRIARRSCRWVGPRRSPGALRHLRQHHGWPNRP